jgi:hypothetical protein
MPSKSNIAAAAGAGAGTAVNAGAGAGAGAVDKTKANSKVELSEEAVAVGKQIKEASLYKYVYKTVVAKLLHLHLKGLFLDGRKYLNEETKKLEKFIEKKFQGITDPKEKDKKVTSWYESYNAWRAHETFKLKDDLDRFFNPAGRTGDAGGGKPSRLGIMLKLFEAFPSFGAIFDKAYKRSSVGVLSDYSEESLKLKSIQNLTDNKLAAAINEKISKKENYTVQVALFRAVWMELFVEYAQYYTSLDKLRHFVDLRNQCKNEEVCSLHASQIVELRPQDQFFYLDDEKEAYDIWRKALKLKYAKDLAKLFMPVKGVVHGTEAGFSISEFLTLAYRYFDFNDVFFMHCFYSDHVAPLQNQLDSIASTQGGRWQITTNSSGETVKTSLYRSISHAESQKRFEAALDAAGMVDFTKYCVADEEAKRKDDEEETKEECDEQGNGSAPLMRSGQAAVGFFGGDVVNPECEGFEMADMRQRPFKNN